MLVEKQIKITYRSYHLCVSARSLGPLEVIWGNYGFQNFYFLWGETIMISLQNTLSTTCLITRVQQKYRTLLPSSPSPPPFFFQSRTPLRLSEPNVRFFRPWIFLCWVNCVLHDVFKIWFKSAFVYPRIVNLLFFQL